MIEQHSSFRLHVIIILVFLNKLLLEKKKRVKEENYVVYSFKALSRRRKNECLIRVQFFFLNVN